MNIPTKDQTVAFGRHVVTFSMGVVTAASLMHLITPDQSGSATNAIQQISEGLKEIIAGMTTLVALASALWASISASPLRQLLTVASSPQVEQVVVKPALADVAAKNDKINTTAK